MSTENEGKGLKTLTEEHLKKTDVWGLFGWGTNSKGTVRAMPFIAEPERAVAGQSLADNAVPQGWIGKYTRHVLDPLPDGLEFDASNAADRLLLLEGPLPEGEPPLPIYFGPTMIKGPFVIIWHDSRTGTDFYIHCPSCLANTAAFVNGMQDKWEAVYSTMSHEGVTYVAPSAALN